MNGVLLTCTNTKKYLDWLPYTIKSWRKIGVEPYVVLVGNGFTFNPDCEHTTYNSDLNVPNSSISQTIRLIYPKELKQFKSVIIADVDQLPINKAYFDKYFKLSINTPEKFYALRKIGQHYYMGWNMATPKTWEEVFGSDTVDEWLRKVYNPFAHHERKDYDYGNRLWGLDQDLLRKILITKDNVVSFENLDKYAVYPKDGDFWEAGIYERNKKKPHKRIELKDITDKHVLFGTAGAEVFDERLIKLILNE